jgi:hypothetical protein
MSTFGLEAPPTIDQTSQRDTQGILFSRVWAMPSTDTFDVPPIAGFVQKYLLKSKVSVDPFARNKRWATYTNDLNPDTAATEHMDAEEFCRVLKNRCVEVDLVLFDPPYSNEQMSRSYKDAGFTPSMETTQNGAMYSRVRNALVGICLNDCVVLSFGWNSSGMGEKRGFEILEILLVAHGGAHNDTICIAERRKPKEPELWPHI